MLDWLIIGGGIHGTHLSNFLVRHAQSTDSVRVVDPHAVVCQRWQKLTAATGMTFLRSPSVHHLGLSSMELEQFESAHKGFSWARSLPPYGRPSLVMFNKHIDTVVRNAALQSTRIQGTAQAMRRIKGGILVSTENLEIPAKRVILAISSNDKPLRPSWASHSDARITHAFEDSFAIDRFAPDDKIVVVGGGITAVQIALRLAASSNKTVSLIVKRPLTVALFDADPCWMGPKCLDGFARETSYEKRRAMIKGARNKGTVTPEVLDALKRAIRAGEVRLHLDEVHSIKESPNAHLVGSEGKRICGFDKIVLATGFAPGRPGGQWLDKAIKDLRLPVAPDGFPTPDRDLQWADGIFVTGALAELELGPPARNILGARMASERLRKFLHSSEFGTVAS
jgi:cation diffusion facilitator CzcD-associated flavoprotein CzcO